MRVKIVDVNIYARIVQEVFQEPPRERKVILIYPYPRVVAEQRQQEGERVPVGARKRLPRPRAGEDKQTDKARPFLPYGANGQRRGGKKPQQRRLMRGVPIIRSHEGHGSLHQPGAAFRLDIFEGEQFTQGDVAQRAAFLQLEAPLLVHSINQAAIERERITEKLEGLFDGFRIGLSGGEETGNGQEEPIIREARHNTTPSKRFSQKREAYLLKGAAAFFFIHSAG